ncbi:hypothetical protein ACLK1T_16840 [Escherichia coli]
MIEVTGVTLKLNHTVTADRYRRSMKRSSPVGSSARSAYRRDESSEGIELSRCTARQSAGGRRIAIVGCGGIGFDTAMYLSQPGESTSQNIAGFCNEWGSTAAYNGWWLKPAGNANPA